MVFALEAAFGHAGLLISGQVAVTIDQNQTRLRATFRGGAGLPEQADMPLNGGGCATPDPLRHPRARGHRCTFRKKKLTAES